MPLVAVSYTHLVQDMKVKRIPVTMGVDGDVVVEVIPTDGTVLEEGMQVITNPGPHLMDGAAAVSYTHLILDVSPPAPSCPPILW